MSVVEKENLQWVMALYPDFIPSMASTRFRIAESNIFLRSSALLCLFLSFIMLQKDVLTRRWFTDGNGMLANGVAG